jgi:hypothetical protein
MPIQSIYRVPLRLISILLPPHRWFSSSVRSMSSKGNVPSERGQRLSLSAPPRPRTNERIVTMSDRTTVSTSYLATHSPHSILQRPLTESTLQSRLSPTPRDIANGRLYPGYIGSVSPPPRRNNGTSSSLDRLAMALRPGYPTSRDSTLWSPYTRSQNFARTVTPSSNQLLLQGDQRAPSTSTIASSDVLIIGPPAYSRQR